MTPYFLPDAALVTALNVAAMRGVEVDVVLPGARATCRSCSGRRPRSSGRCSSAAAGSGSRLAPFDHTKLMAVDGAWSLLGSANWDPRSLRLNFELHVEGYDPDLAARVEALAEERLARARPLTLAEMDRRPLAVKLRDGVARLLSPYL